MKNIFKFYKKENKSDNINLLINLRNEKDNISERISQFNEFTPTDIYKNLSQEERYLLCTYINNYIQVYRTIDKLINKIKKETFSDENTKK